MKINKIRAKNFRLLFDTTLEIKDSLSVLIGKNNTGKTSLIVLLEKFIIGSKFNFYDFPTSIKQKILNLNASEPKENLSIQLLMQIKYDGEDNLDEFSELIPDLDANISTINILFQTTILKDSLLYQLQNCPNRERYLSKNLEKHLETNFYIFEDKGSLDITEDTILIEKDIQQIRKVINLQIIHAKRNVSSSEEFRKESKVLSGLTTKFFKANSASPEKVFQDINNKMAEIDADLDSAYQSVFEPFLKSAKDFLKLTDLKVISDIQSNELVSDTSQVVYGDLSSNLPEHLNGLGVMNILFLLLQIEMKKEEINLGHKPINLLIIEEPEAHTHPQMQYVFATQIKKIISEIDNLQAIITTHSSHIVSQCNFKDIRYLHRISDYNIVAKNFYEDLRKLYSDQDQFHFLVQYLTINSSELFFADKIIFIEGATERILLPYFIKQHDEGINKEVEIPLSAQHISILEVGANAKVFAPLLSFLGIKTLVITDLDSTKADQVPTKSKTSLTGVTTTYSECEVSSSTHTSNYSLHHFYSAPTLAHSDFLQWYSDLKDKKLKCYDQNIYVAYQCEESGYYARSFEDAFIHINRPAIIANLKRLQGLKNKSLYEDKKASPYRLAKDTIEKKSEFASSILYLALAGKETEVVEWTTPFYISEAFKWLAK